MSKRQIILQNEKLQRRYFWTKDDTITEGDFCVVKTKEGLSVWPVAQATGFEEVPDSPNVLWIVQKVDLTSFNKQMHKDERQSKVIAKIRQEESQIPERARLKELAKTRPRIKELLDELDAIEAV